MNKLETIRERIERATSYFETREGVVLTTFNLNGQFLEEQALPIIFGVEATTATARSASLHQRLAETPCTVFYDPTIAPGVSNKFRYVARPVPLRGRLFHPKLVIMAGRSEDATAWVYLAVSSANLTLSGWGRNAESFGETWIHTRKQQAWGGLDRFLEWLQKCAFLGERTGGQDAVTVIRAVLAGMPNRKRLQDKVGEPWSGALQAQFYSSVVNVEGLPSFLKKHRKRKPRELWVYSPYWSKVAEGVDKFGARNTVLIPALRRDRKAMGLSRDEQAALDGRAEIYGNAQESEDDRFWHMKAYWILHGKTTYTAVGSCNFTKAGLVGSSGNVEAMLVFETMEPEWPQEKEGPIPPASNEMVVEEDVPNPVPIAIIVAYDWRSGSWRWFLEAGRFQSAFRLNLPGHSDALAIVPGSGEFEGEVPPRPAQYSVTYKESGNERNWQGQVVELNLDHSRRVYGRPLSASEILESWRDRVPISGRGGGGVGSGDDNEGDEIESLVLAAFDAVNLYDLYRAMRGLRTRLDEHQTQPHAQRALLVGHPNSVMALANLADGGEVPVVRYLVLLELSSLMADYKESLQDEDIETRVSRLAENAKQETISRLARELGGDSAKAQEMLNWFESRLAEMGDATR